MGHLMVKIKKHMEFCVRHRVHPCPPHQTDLAIDVDLRGSFRAYRWNSGTWSLNQKHGDACSKIDKGAYPM